MPLELKDLTEDERIALVALLQQVVEADSYVTDPEASRVRAIIKAIGKTAYDEAVEASDRRFEDAAELRRFVPTIARQEARELIYETLLETALADAPAMSEAAILDWLAGIWTIKTRIVPPDKAAD
ncbi:MAG: TerB family tellurite resistance protein [Candidatus Binatia bacterium]